MHTKEYIKQNYKALASAEREKLSKWLEENETEILDDIVEILLSKTVTKVKFAFPSSYNGNLSQVYHEVAEGNDGIIELSGVHSNTAETLYDWLVERFGIENVMLNVWLNNGTAAEVILSGLDKIIK